MPGPGNDNRPKQHRQGVIQSSASSLPKVDRGDRKGDLICVGSSGAFRSTGNPIADGRRINDILQYLKEKDEPGPSISDAEFERQLDGFEEDAYQERQRQRRESGEEFNPD